jgi:hypothetical protein
VADLPHNANGRLIRAELIARAAADAEADAEASVRQ